MPRDFDYVPPAHGSGPYPADQPGWCDAILAEERPVRSLVLPHRRAASRALPASDDLLGWSVLLLTAPVVLLAGALILGQALWPVL